MLLPTAMRHGIRVAAMNLAAVLAAVGALPAVADEADEQVIEEVIVTATKREVSLQDSSLAITAYTGEQLDNRGVRDLMDIASAVPGVDVGDVAPGKGTLIFRGLSVVTSGIGRGSVSHQQTNISYLDDIVLFPGITPIELIDVERVEILKGPLRYPVWQERHGWRRSLYQ